MIKNSDFIKGDKYSIRQIYDYGNDLKNIINYKLQQLVWHRIATVKSLYKDALGIEFPGDISVVQKAINTRHDIIHRNGFDRRGNKVSISKSDMIELKCSVEDLVTFINDQALDRFKIAAST